MKKVLITCVAGLAMSLTACVSTGTSGTNAGTGSATTGLGTAAQIGRNIFSAAVDNQCRTQLRNNSAFRLVALATTAEKQTELEDGICGCVSEHAPQSITVVELAQAATDPNARTTIVANSVQKTLTACYAKFIK